MSRFFEEAQERRLHEYVARQLGVTVEVLDDYPYQIDENVSDDGIVYGWRVQWDEAAPPGVTAHGAQGGQWSDIAVDHDDPDPED